MKINVRTKKKGDEDQCVSYKFVSDKIEYLKFNGLYITKNFKSERC